MRKIPYIVFREPFSFSKNGEREVWFSSVEKWRMI
jgi:hypothetical protein